MGHCRICDRNRNNRRRRPDFPNPHVILLVRRTTAVRPSCLNTLTRTQQWIWVPIIGLFIMVGLAGAGATAGTLIMVRALSSREGLVKYVSFKTLNCMRTTNEYIVDG
jgi:hypothetical protein